MKLEDADLYVSRQGPLPVALIFKRICLTIFSISRLLICTLAATSLYVHTSSFVVQMKNWQQLYIFPAELGLTTSQAGGDKVSRDRVRLFL